MSARIGYYSSCSITCTTSSLYSEKTLTASYFSTSSTSSTLLDMQERAITAVVRASVYYYNSEEEVERFTKAVAQIG